MFCRGNASTHVVMLDCCCNSLGWNNNNSNDSSGDSNVNKNTNSNNNSNKAPKNINSYTTLYECTNVRDINEITASLETIIKGRIEILVSNYCWYGYTVLVRS